MKSNFYKGIERSKLRQNLDDSIYDSVELDTDGEFQSPKSPKKNNLFQNKEIDFIQEKINILHRELDLTGFKEYTQVAKQFKSFKLSEELVSLENEVLKEIKEEASIFKEFNSDSKLSNLSKEEYEKLSPSYFVEKFDGNFDDKDNLIQGLAQFFIQNKYLMKKIVKLLFKEYFFKAFELKDGAFFKYTDFAKFEIINEGTKSFDESLKFLCLKVENLQLSSRGITVEKDYFKGRLYANGRGNAVLKDGSTKKFEFSSRFYFRNDDIAYAEDLTIYQAIFVNYLALRFL